MLVELLYMRTIPRKYRKLHIVIRFNEYFGIIFELSILRMANFGPFSTDIVN